MILMSCNPSGSLFGLEMVFGWKVDSVAAFKRGETSHSSNKSAIFSFWPTGVEPYSSVHSEAPEGRGAARREVRRRVVVDGKPHLPTDVVAQSQRPRDLHHRRPVPHRRRGDLMMFWWEEIGFPPPTSDTVGIWCVCLKENPSCNPTSR